MKRPSRVSILHASFLVFAFFIVGRAGYVQLWQRNTWKLAAARQHNTSQVLPAPRGQILDATGTVLVESRQLVELAVAPKEMRRGDVPRLARALASVKVQDAVIDKAKDTMRAWVPVPGRFLAADVSALTALRGVHAEPVLERVPSPLVGLRGLIGHAAPDGDGVDGIELSLDTLLRGVPGRMASVRDGRRNQLLTPERESVEPIAGHTVELTIRLDLQDISERALGDAVQRTGAHGGDIVVLDPRSGEILALASQRRDAQASATALTEPVEPGSTLKPFVAAALLARGRVQLEEVFNTYNGTWKMFGFPITDVHKAPRMTFKEVIEYSSNIGMAQAAMRLTPREEYEALRDFGFGTPTGLPFPSEAGGHLAEPKHWSALSQASLARGYEMNATPVQLAMAYGAIANGGELLEPALVKQIRDSKGAVVYEHERQVVRRAISKPIAAKMRTLLRAVVDSGTAMKADLAMYEVGGKSGTARRTGANGKYIPNDYTATFVGLFPADEPQLVVLVKLDSPSGAGYYGGQIAAPVTRAVLEAALASSDAVLDRTKLRQRPRAQSQVVATSASHDSGAADLESDGSVQYVLNLARPVEDADVVLGPRPVPDVRGMSVRSAAAALHRAGFRVRLERGSDKAVTVPAAGTVARAGTLVRLQLGL